MGGCEGASVRFGVGAVVGVCCGRVGGPSGLRRADGSGFSTEGRSAVPPRGLERGREGGFDSGSFGEKGTGLISSRALRNWRRFSASLRESEADRARVERQVREASRTAMKRKRRTPLDLVEAGRTRKQSGAHTRQFLKARV
jgi:hypothetical protein